MNPSSSMRPFLKHIALLFSTLLIVITVSPLFIHIGAANYYISPTGSDSNSGSFSSPWATPNHYGLNCGDTVTWLDGTYTTEMYVAIPSITCGSVHGAAVRLTCQDFDKCVYNITSGGQYANAFEIEVSNIQLDGFDISVYAGGGQCIGMYPLTSTQTIHDVVAVNNVLHQCGTGGISSSTNGSAGVDYRLVAANYVGNAAQGSSLCASGVNSYSPVAYDTLPGTHYYDTNNFVFNTVNPLSGCAGTGPTDGQGGFIDTTNGYTQQMVMDSSIFGWNGGAGVKVYNSGVAPIYIRHITTYGNERGQVSGGVCAEALLQAAAPVQVYQSLFVVGSTTNGCVGNTPIYAMGVVIPTPQDQLYGNWAYSPAGNNTTGSASGFSFGPNNVFNSNPNLANPVQPSDPNCSTYTSVMACMAGVGIIANYAQTNSAAGGYGYQTPTTSSNYDPLFPKWACNLNLPAGVMTMYCSQQAGTGINITSLVSSASPKRLGINIASSAPQDYGSEQVNKDYFLDAYGFEGTWFQSMIRCGNGTDTTYGTNCESDEGYASWPGNFWAGATYTFVAGNAIGQTGTVYSQTANGNPIFGFNPTLGVTAKVGDYMIVSQHQAGNLTNALVNGGGGGWRPSTAGTGAMSIDVKGSGGDVGANGGTQSLRMTNLASGDTCTITQFADAPPYGSPNHNFRLLNGNYQLQFDAKNLSGNNQILTYLYRGTATPSTYIPYGTAKTIGNTWQTYTIPFTANETTATGINWLQLQLWYSGTGVMLLDNVKIVPVGGDSTNTTVYSDGVVAALRSLNPGVIRYWYGQLGDSIANLVAAPESRQNTNYRANGQGYSALASTPNLHEFLQLCQLIGAEPWAVIPITTTNAEAAYLIDYLAGPGSTAGGAQRIALGQTAPWTQVFSKIHLEFGNEAWNNGSFAGGDMDYPDAYAIRAQAVFGAMIADSNYSASNFDLVLGGQAAVPGGNTYRQSFCNNNTSMAVAPYTADDVQSFGSTDALWSSTMAEGEADVVSTSTDSAECGSSTGGCSYQNFTQIPATAGRPVVMNIYELNAQTVQGTLDQNTMNSYTPSVGMGIAVVDHALQLQQLGYSAINIFSLPQWSAGTFGAPLSVASYMPLFGTVVDFEVTNRKRGQFYAEQLANSAIQGSMYQINMLGDNPTWSVSNASGVSANNGVTISNAHYLHAFKYASSSGNHALILDNMSDGVNQGALTVVLNGSGAPPVGSTVTQTLLTSANINDTNENSQVFAPVTTTLSNFNPAANYVIYPYTMVVLSWTSSGGGGSGGGGGGGTPPPPPSNITLNNVAVTPTQAILRYSTSYSGTTLVQVADLNRGLGVSSITQSGGVATVTTQIPHGLLGTVPVFLDNTCVSAWNTWQTATVTGSNTFTFSTSTSGSCASGNIGVLSDDVNATLFPGSNLDSRAGNATPVGGSREFVLGTPGGAQLASDGNYHTRILQAYSRHHFTVTAGTGTYDGEFTTLNLPLGDTRDAGIPADPLHPGMYAYPTTPWSNPAQALLDPIKGVRSYLAAYPTGGASAVRNFQIGSGSGWSNPSNPLTSSGGSASCASPCSSSNVLFLGTGSLTLPGGASYSLSGGSQASLDWFQPTLTLSGAVADTVTVGITADGVTMASSKTCSITTSPSSCTLGTQNAMDLWQASGEPPVTSVDASQFSGTVATNGAAFAWVSGNKFSTRWAAGSRITINGTQYAIASMQSELAGTLATSAGVQASASYTAANFGILIAHTSGVANTISVGYSTYQYGSTGNPGWFPDAQMSCGPTVSAAAGNLCVVDYVNPSDQSLVGELYLYPASGGAPVDLGRASTQYGGSTPYFGADQPCALNGVPSQFDPADGTSGYCLYNVNYVGYTILRWHYNGTYQPVAHGTQIPDCAQNGNTQPCLVWTVMTGTNPSNVIANLGAAFNSDFTASGYSSLFTGNNMQFDGVSSDGYLQVHTRITSQDDVGWIWLFALGDRTPYGTDSNSFRPVASFSSYRVAPCSWCTIHGASVPDSGWASIQSNDMDYHGFSATYGTTISSPTNLSATLAGCPTNSFGVTGTYCTQITLAGEPLSNDGHSSFLQNIQLGDFINLDYYGTKEYGKVLATCGTNCYWVQRGQGGSSVVSHTGPLTAVMACGTRNSSTAAVALWHYSVDPYGTNSAGTTLINDPQATQGHGVPNGGAQYPVTFTAGAAGNIPQTACPSNTIASDCAGVRPGVLAAAAGETPFGVVTNPLFASKLGVGSPNNVDDHPGPCFNGWCWDGRVMNGGGTGINSFSNVTGNIWKSTGNTLNVKQLPTLAYVGRSPLVDVSGPGSGIASGGSYTYCYALFAGECYAGSSAGDIYVNAPFVSSGTCSYPGIAVSPGDQNMICVGNLGAYTGHVVQYGAASQDVWGFHNRSLGPNYARWSLQDVYRNEDGVPNGLAYISYAPWLGGAATAQLNNVVPPYAPWDGVARNTFVPYSVPINPPSNLGVSSVQVEFGYAQNALVNGNYLQCTSRQEVCAAVGSTVNEAAPFYYASESFTPLACSSGCTVVVPALSSQVLYYRRRYLNSSGQTVYLSQIYRDVIP